MVSAYLKYAGYEITTAKDASEAMRTAEGLNLGLIVLDLDLAGEDGIMLMKFLKFNHPNVPVILYTTGEPDAAAVQKMLSQGAHQCVRKGRVEDLADAVRGILA